MFVKRCIRRSVIVILIIIIFCTMLHNIKFWKPSPTLKPSILPENFSKTKSGQCLSLQRVLKFDTLRGIPKLLHFTYKSDQLPESYFKEMKKCAQMNPDYQIVLWTTQAAKRMIENEFSNEMKKYYHGFDKMHEIFNSDVFRYYFLYRYGGVYLDLDVECLRPLSSGIPIIGSTEKERQSSCILDQEPNIQTRIDYGIPYSAMNSAMLCKAKHPFFKDLIMNLKSQKEGKTSTVDLTGPAYLTKLYNQYNSQQNNTNSVILAHFEVFSPLVDKYPIIQNCGTIRRSPHRFKDFQTEDCKDIRKKLNAMRPTNRTIGIHHFTHMGYFNRKDKQRHFSVCKEIPNVAIYT